MNLELLHISHVDVSLPMSPGRFMNTIFVPLCEPHGIQVHMLDQTPCGTVESGVGLGVQRLTGKDRETTLR